MTPLEAQQEYDRQWPALNANKEAATTDGNAALAKRCRQLLTQLSDRYGIRHELRGQPAPVEVSTVWILTSEVNDYDQHGEYFLAVYATQPTHQQLTAEGIPTNILRHVLNGGGRVDDEYRWYYLREETPL